MAIQWLVDCGLVYKVNRISKPAMPLKFYEEFLAFKLYLLDCGLLGAMTDTAASDVLIGNMIFEEYKGAFTELYVLQQLKTLSNIQVYYFSNENSTLEIDFVVQQQGQIFPIEVKTEENLRSKSLRAFIDKHNYLKGIRFSMSAFADQEWILNVPLYAVERYFNCN